MNKRTTPGLIGLGLFILLAILPIAFSIGYAFSYSTGMTGLLSDGFTLAHWKNVIQGNEIWSSLGLSIYISACTVIITVVLALIASLLFRDPLSQGPLSYIIYLPLAIPATVAAFLVFQLLSGAGFVSRILTTAGLIHEITELPDLINDAAGVGIIAAHVSMAVPFFIILFHEVYTRERIDELSQLAGTLGAKPHVVLYRITLPILVSKALMNIILLFVIVLGSYEIPLLLGRQSPEMASVLTMRKYQLFDISEKPEAFIMALLYTSLVLALLFFVFKRLDSKHSV